MELKTTTFAVPESGVGVLTLHRPDRLNTWTGRMHTEIRWVMEQAEADPGVRVVIITGSGRGFCAGADSRALETHVDRGGYDPGTPADVANPGYGLDDAFDADFAWMLALNTVTVAAVNGPAAGVGFVLASYCDVRFVAADAKLTAAHGRLNLPVEYGLSWLLPRIVGLTHANDLLLSSRIMVGERAAEIGWAVEALDAAQVFDRSLEYARDMVARVSPASLATSKRQIALDLLHDDPATAVRNAQSLLDAMTKEPDYTEAIRAFIARDRAQWTQPPTATSPPMPPPTGA